MMISKIGVRRRNAATDDSGRIGAEMSAHDVLHHAYMRATSLRAMLILLHAIRHVSGK